MSLGPTYLSKAQVNDILRTVCSLPKGGRLSLLSALEYQLREVKVGPLPVDYINFKAELMEYITVLLTYM